MPNTSGVKYEMPSLSSWWAPEWTTTLAVAHIDFPEDPLAGEGGGRGKKFLLVVNNHEQLLGLSKWGNSGLLGLIKVGNFACQSGELRLWHPHHDVRTHQGQVKNYMLPDMPYTIRAVSRFCVGCEIFPLEQSFQFVLESDESSSSY